MSTNLLNIRVTNFSYLSYFNFNSNTKSKDITTYIPDKNIPIIPPLKTSFKQLKSKK